MDTPNDRVYADTHEWFKEEGAVVTVGLTAHAVDQLTDITFVDMKGAGESVSVGDSLGEVESVKTTSDVYTAVAGEIAEVNPALADNPELLNEDPYGKGWLVKIKVSDRGNLGELMDAAAYDQTAG